MGAAWAETNLIHGKYSVVQILRINPMALGTADKSNPVHLTQHFWETEEISKRQTDKKSEVRKLNVEGV